jgi:amino acid adenylation domain-containing protein
MNFNFPPALTGSLRTLAQREGTTLFMVLLSGFTALLWKYTGQTDILIGTPAANRSRREVEDLIGLFLNMLVLRTDLGGDPSFSHLLGRVRQTALEAYDHQDMPFEQLVEELQPKRDRSRSPLFQVVFALQNVPSTPLQLSGLEVRPLEVSTATSKFDLSVAVTEAPDGMFATWEYNTDIYEGETVERMAGHYVGLLESAVAEPGRALSGLSMLAEPERRQICQEWNQTGKDPGPIQRIDQLVEAQAARGPERIALVFAGQSLGYAELNGRANQLAHRLRSLGVGPETLVAISIGRSLEMVIAVLGVLKAGGAYVPVDPSYPHERLAMLLADSGAKVLLTEEKLAGKLPAHQARTLCLDSEWASIAQNPATNLELPLEPTGLAYVIYTSGSTGRPKGVQITHRAVVNFLRSMSVEPGMTPDDVLLAVTSLSFDIAGLELFLPLSLGAKVVIASQEASANGAELLGLLSGCQPTVMQATPVTWRLLLGAGWSGSARLKILCGGEAMPRELAAALLAKGKEVWNMYGPTETTIWSTLCRVSPREGSVSIGRPIANTQVYVLDHHLQPVPVGVPGELYIGGLGLARGYLKRPELTAERFVRNPFSDDPKERLYKTGDSVRYRPDGNLEFYGRLDDQVKVRGYRIELGEVESALKLHPQVKEAVVVVRPDGTGENRLIAYLVMQDPSALAELSGFLRTKLPAYMAPAVFVPIPSFPVTPNGKVDRRALPEPAPVRPQLAVEFAPPRNPLEELLARTYATVLGLDRVGIHDNFFELGGASLSSLQITANLHETGVPIPPAWIFEHQTIAELAAAAAAGEGASPSGQLAREHEPVKI